MPDAAIPQCLAEALAASNHRVVFAESCTGGMACALLSQVPGISNWLCGSAVTYREQTKQAWLDVSHDVIARFSAVSEPVTREMARRVLERTPEADLSLAVTGHLGPEAPVELDGIVYVAIARRHSDRIEIAHAERLRLTADTRISRQKQAAEWMLQTLYEFLAKRSAD